MGDEPKMVIQVDNKELMEYFESWLEDFKRVSEGMLEKINVDRGATLKIPEADFRRIKMLTEALDGVAKKKFGFENAPDFAPMVASMKRLEACMEKIYIPEQIEVKMPNIEFPAIPAPTIDFTPILKGFQDMTKLFQQGIPTSITNFDQMPLVFDKVTSTTGGGTGGGGDASEATLLSILSAISDVVTNTAAISIDADSVNLNTDTLETLIAAGNASLATLAGAVAGTEMQVDIVAPLPAGTNAIGKLAANSGVVIGAVEIASAQTIAVTVPSDPFGTNADAASSSGSISAKLKNISQAVHVGDTPLIATMVVGAQFDDVSPSTVTENSVRALRMSSRRELYGQIRDAAGNERGANVNASNELNVALSSLPAVHFQDVYVTGQGSQMNLNQNVILASAGSGSYDTLNGTTGISFRSVSLTITPAAGTVTAGVISFEGSNDNTNFVAVFLTDSANVTAIPVSTITLAANTSRYLIGSIPFRYFRARISTGITGTTTGVQCFSVFSTVPYSSPRLTVSQATAASLNVTVAGSLTTVTTLTNITNWGNIVDNAAFTDGTTRLLMSGYIFDEVAGTALTENDAAAARIDSKRAQVMVIEDATTRGTRAAVTASGLATTSVGTIADDATTPGAPIMIGGWAKETDGTDPGSVSAEDDVARIITDRNRRMLINDMHPNSFVLFEDHTTAQTNNQLKAAPGAGLSIYITDVIFSNGATAGSIKLVEDEGGTPVQIGATVYMAINGGAVMNFKTPKRLTANKSLGFTSTTVTTHTVEIHGYIAP